VDSLGWSVGLAPQVGPDFGGVGASGTLAEIVGALLTVVLIVAVLMLVACAIGWAVASASGNYQAVARARGGLWVAIGAAALAGGGVTWMNFLLRTGSSL
jgi:steroid 5-alpha reductase family enzyme